ncbi:MAG: acyl-CoA/acyl-ACP dehydrogenase [Deltaproteobacteria bacterium]|nr:acyl-CoA/acyl-ACP dehydrogenase [Deltaproteobacteria bacterium]
MDFEIEKDRNLIKKSARELFVKEAALESTREIFWESGGCDQKIWKKMVGLGYAGLCIPEKYMGQEGDFFDAVLVMEEIGRYAVEVPFCETSVMGAGLLEDLAGEKLKKALLKKIASKGSVCSLALLEETFDFSTVKIATEYQDLGDKVVIDGSKIFVPYAEQADHLIVCARKQGTAEEDGLAFFVVPAGTQGLSINIMPTIGTKKYREVVLDGVTLEKDKALGLGADGSVILQELMAKGAVLKAAEMLGGAQAALEATVKYTKERTQFGKAIGSFQVVQHSLVEMLTQVDGLRNLVYRAAWKIDQGMPFLADAGMAKIMANETYNDVCYDAMVLHGAYGWTMEADLGIYLVKAKDLENCCGNNAYHEKVIARQYESEAGQAA